MEAMCNNKEWRKDFVERYLNAETTREEERLFAQFCQQAGSDSLTEEEWQVGMLLQYAPEVSAESLDMNAVAEFDRLFPKKNKARRWLPAMSAVAAVLVAVVAAWALVMQQPAEMGEDLWSLTALCESITDIFPDAASINIERNGDSLLVTVMQDDGTHLIFTMDRESFHDKDTFSLKTVTEN